jgi:hypothetical protein
MCLGVHGFPARSLHGGPPRTSESKQIALARSQQHCPARAAYAFCLADGQRVEPPASLCARWLAELHPAAPPEDRWQAVPRRLLPPNVQVAYFNARQFFAAHFEQPPTPPRQPAPFTGRGRRLGD